MSNILHRFFGKAVDTALELFWTAIILSLIGAIGTALLYIWGARGALLYVCIGAVAALAAVIILAFILGRFNARRLVATRMLEKEQFTRCLDPNLHAIATNDSGNINRVVVVIGGSVNNKTSDDIPYVEFTFTVFNGSVFILSIEAVTGYIQFNHKRFNSNGIEMIIPIRGFRHGDIQKLKVRHNLSPYEFELVSKSPEKDEAFFDLNYLDIMITGKDVESGRLSLPEGIYISGKILWRDR
jgi:hypothetical protein